MVSRQSLLECLGIVVRTLNEGFAGDVVLHVRLWGVENLVIASTGGRMNEASSDAGNEQSIVNLKLNGMFERNTLVLQHLVKLFGLSDGSRKAIEDEAR